MKKICIIPARGGSKRLPGKNVEKINDKPLIYHTIEATLGLFDKIVVTSDSENILQIVRDGYENYSSENNNQLDILKRPEELATDTSKVIDTVSYYFDKYQNEGYEQIWLCLPTCPLRNREDIVNAQNELTSEIDGVISITEYEFPPSLGLLKGAKGNLVPYDQSDPWRTGNSRSQDHAAVYRPNGAMYGMWSESFNANRNFYKGEILGYYMPRERSVDIDTKFDFVMAETMMNLNV